MQNWASVVTKAFGPKGPARAGLWILLSTATLALCFCLSPLSLVPVPWPDDSAFYFVAHDLFQWPTRGWIMSVQAAFEPSYLEWNFNTMPLYPILIGLGRFIGIDGIQGIRFYPLFFWILSGALLLNSLRKKVSTPWLALGALFWITAPITRWGATLARPESFIGLCGVWILISLQKPKSKQAQPIAIALTAAAYAHFNAIHLVLPVLAAYAPYKREDRKVLLKIAGLTLLGLSPWLLSVAFHFQIFLNQFALQSARLAVSNPWLTSLGSLVHELWPDMGVPEGWPAWLRYATLMIVPLFFWSQAVQLFKKTSPQMRASSMWILSSAFLYHFKPESWFVYYLHLSLGTFLVLNLASPRSKSNFSARTLIVALLIYGSAALAYQASGLYRSETWNWNNYRSLVECVDEKLTEIESKLESKKGMRAFQLWGPTFPDVLIELSRRHPKWEMTRTNDFEVRAPLAIAHAFKVNAMVVTEQYARTEMNRQGPAETFGEHSVWMGWTPYFLNKLQKDPAWKREVYLCQRGKWQAFIYYQ